MTLVRQDITERRQKQGLTTGGVIYDLFVEMLKTSDALMCLNLLSIELKEQRNRVVSTGEQANQLPIQKKLSLELLWRNAIVCRQSHPSDDDNESIERLIVQRYFEYIRAGFPFEIIDGDNYYFPHSFLAKALSNFRNKRILVISVIGPQNSGKSTLLNYMFGTFFDVRDGRCTRGIYGSFVKSNRRDFDYIMIIDTEGLLGVEREDKEFDRRLVLFCLAVSHLVIVNMIGEVNESLKTMLTLCADSLKQMNVNRVPQPTVHFILNQKADLNIQNNQAAIDKIIADLKSFDLSGMIDIKPETFHTLPNAFKKERGPLNDTNLPCLIKTEPDFIELVQLLCGKIVNSALACLSRSSEQFTDPLHWLQSAITVFDTLQKFADLTYYRDIDERRQDYEIREYISAKLAEEFSSPYRDQITAESVNKNERQIEEMLIPEMEKKQKDLNEDLEKHLKSTKTSDTIRKRCKQFLLAQIIEQFNALRTTCKMVSERAQVQLLVQSGTGDLKQLIEDIIAKGTLMSEQSASEDFDHMYNSIIKNIKKNFDKKERVTLALRHIYSIYCIYEKNCLPDYNSGVLNHLPWLQHLTSEVQEEYILDELAVLFTQVAYEYPLVEEHTFTPDAMNPYSTKVIEDLVHLNQKLLKHRFKQFLASNSITEPTQKELSTLRYVLNAIKNQVVTSKEEKYTAATKNFLCLIRKDIKHEWKSVSKDRSIVSDDDSHVQLHIQASKLLRNVIQSIVKATRGNTADETRQIQTDLIQKIVGVISTLIKDINLELSPFCLSLNKPLKSTFHICAIVLLTKYYYNEQENHFLQTLNTLNNTKDHLKSYFITMVVLNISNDSNGAVSLCKQLKDYMLKSFVDEGQKSINSELRKYDNLNRKWVQDRCDGELLSAEKKWFMDYIENPTKVIEQSFNDTWNNIKQSINQNLIQLKMYHIEALVNFFYCIQAQLYKPDIKLMEITKAMTTVYHSCTIDNLSAFLHCVLQEKGAMLTEFGTQKCDFDTIDTQDTYARLLDKIRGCPDRCPWCQRPCDVDHTLIKSNPGSESNKRRCATGHALRAMNGYKFEETDEASLFMCEQIKDGQTIVVGSLRKRWSQFKLDHRD
ncbi:unnamed protein product [Didymodactylos carnosus]|uniref:VLIG-type G domain-containing protein n=1 Tax=Didymodactylos carnosus TaxID=1234261 RepID=A0A8S2DV82_9BILA|nr:unnamed protein product [Didymodactylos carnosus]CAF3812085.1 unnamed protein product [Didymodactylos carnosus]